MLKDNRFYNILVVEDNEGDFFLVEEYLDEQMVQINLQRTSNFAQTKELFASVFPPKFDVILLDLSLPDCQGEQLIKELLELPLNAPVIVLTGFTDLDFAVKALSFGVSDYLLKDNLNGIVLHKSIIYSIERYKNINHIIQSEKKYSSLFHLSPVPMFVVDYETNKIVDANDSAIKAYGYSKNEMIGLPLNKLTDILDCIGHSLKHNIFDCFSQAEAKHILKSGQKIDVQNRTNEILYQNKPARIVISTDITKNKIHTRTIEQQNTKLKEIAWIQSHVVRAPVSRILGLVNLINEGNISSEEHKAVLNYIVNSANELDEIIRKIVDSARDIFIEEDRLNNS